MIACTWAAANAHTIDRIMTGLGRNGRQTKAILFVANISQPGNIEDEVRLYHHPWKQPSFDFDVFLRPGCVVANAGNQNLPMHWCPF